MNRKLFLLLAAILIPFATYSQKNSLNSIKVDELKVHMKYLSSDELKGRKTGNEGNLDAGAYIASEAEKYGLKPLPGQKDFYQTLNFLKITTNPDSSSIILRDTVGNLLCTGNIDPIMVPAERVDLSGEVVFAGYGYMNSKTKYSDFQGLSISNKIVIIMTRRPDLAGSGMPGAGEILSDQVELRKLTPLMMQNPKAILYVADPAYGDKPIKGAMIFAESEKLIPLFKQQQSFDMALNFFAISQETANKILASAGTSLSDLQEKIAATKKPVSFILPNVKANLVVGVQKDTVKSSNIVGFFEGSDPVLKDECVIYTAHYDHVGIDGNGNVDNGANDNASGTIGLLGIARAFSVLDKKPARSVVFLWTTGEEEGLYGSNYYIAHPLFPLEKTVADLNFDMIGRSKMAADTGKVMGERLDITGPDTIRLVSARDCMELINIASTSGKEAGIYVIDDGKGSHFNGSDHYPFALKGIPAVFFFTGLHRDYHKYTDDFEFIDFNKILKVSQAGFLTGYKIANNPTRLMINTGTHN
jgi:hypothetical protein